jgi:hypothetical protein
MHSAGVKILTHVNRPFASANCPLMGKAFRVGFAREIVDFYQCSSAVLRHLIIDRTALALKRANGKA